MQGFLQGLYLTFMKHNKCNLIKFDTPSSTFDKLIVAIPLPSFEYSKYKRTEENAKNKWNEKKNKKELIILFCVHAHIYILNHFF